ncbi:hypothetical protein U1Q18_020762 [Sarracenia purpurea var. burkii]
MIKAAVLGFGGGFVEDWFLALPGCFIHSSVCWGGLEWCPKRVFAGPCFDLSGRVLIERSQRSCSGYDLLEGLLWLMPTLPSPLTGEAFQLSITTLSNPAPSHDHTASLGFPFTSVCFRVFWFLCSWSLELLVFWCVFVLFFV